MQIADYERLLDTIQPGDYSVSCHMTHGTPLILRHDIDAKPEKSVTIAEMENARGIKSSFYCKAEFAESEYLLNLAGLGHEIGYHYACLSTARGDMDAAEILFETELEQMCEVVDVKTICPHGDGKYRNERIISEHSPMGRDDILGDAFLDIPFDSLAYFSDSGNRLRLYDHVPNIFDKGRAVSPTTIDEVIEYIQKGERCYLLMHPQHWS